MDLGSRHRLAGRGEDVVSLHVRQAVGRLGRPVVHRAGRVPVHDPVPAESSPARVLVAHGDGGGLLRGQRQELLDHHAEGDRAIPGFVPVVLGQLVVTGGDLELLAAGRERVGRRGERIDARGGREGGLRVGVGVGAAAGGELQDERGESHENAESPRGPGRAMRPSGTSPFYLPLR